MVSHVAMELSVCKRSEMIHVNTKTLVALPAQVLDKSRPVDWVRGLYMVWEKSLMVTGGI